MKRFALVLAALSLALLMCACSQSEGTANIVSYENKLLGCKFNIENDWAVYPSDDGDSVRFQSPQDTIGVSPASFTVAVSPEPVEDAAGYIEKTAEELRNRGKEVAFTATKLGGEDAGRIEYDIGTEENKLLCVIVGGAKNGLLYTLTFTASVSDRETYLPAYENALVSFEFIARETAEENSAADYSGGRAESVNGDYYFDYPAGWGVIRRDGMLAVGPKDGSASISVTVFSLPAEKSSYGAYDYWKEYAEELGSVLPGFTVTKEYEKENEPRLGGVVAARKEYSAAIDGAEYRYIQVICIYKGYVYSLLFTSDAAEYDTFSPVMDQAVSSFRFN